MKTTPHTLRSCLLIVVGFLISSSNLLAARSNFTPEKPYQSQHSKASPLSHFREKPGNQRISDLEYLLSYPNPNPTSVMLPMMPIGTGNLMFTNVNSDVPERFSIVTTVAILAGTTVTVTDNEWGGASFDADGSDEIYVINFTTNAPCGTEYTFTDNLAPTSNNGSGVSISDNGFSDLEAGGDALYVIDGLYSAPNFISAISFGGGAWGSNGNLPAGLTNDMTALDFSDDNGEYLCGLGSLSTTIMNETFWTTSNSTIVPHTECYWNCSPAGIAPGDIFFTGGNTDAPDGWSFVIRTPITAGTVLHITDNEWDGTTFNTGEGGFLITFTSDAPCGTEFAFSVGAAPVSNNGSTATIIPSTYVFDDTGDALYLIDGSLTGGPSDFVSAMRMSGAWGAGGDNLTNTGLTNDDTAIDFVNDNGGYNCANGTNLFTDVIMNEADWITSNTVANVLTDFCTWDACVGSDIGIMKPDGTYCGDMINLIFYVFNRGPEDDPDVNVIDNFPGSFSNIIWSSSINGVMISMGNGDIDDHISLDQGDTIIYRVMADLPPMTSGTLMNTASVIGSDDFNPANDTDTGNYSEYPNVCNPPLEQVACEDFKIMLVLDASGSIDAGEQQTVRDAAITLVNALTNTGTSLALVQFAHVGVNAVIGSSSDYQEITGDPTIPGPPTGYVADFVNYINNNYPDPANIGTFTNWEDGFIAALTLAPANLMLFMTDGDPTAYNCTGLTDPPCTNFNNTFGHGVCYEDDQADCEDAALAAAIVQSDIVKTEGTHLYVFAVADAPDLVNIAQISGPMEDLCPDTDFGCINQNPTDPHFNMADFTTVSFQELAFDLANFTEQACQSDIDIQKTVYAGHNSGSGCPGVDTLVGSSGTLITYCFTITNIGDDTLDFTEFDDPALGINVTNLGMLDGLIDAGPGTWPLAPAEVITYYYETTITDSLCNVAAITATSQTSMLEVTDNDQACVEETGISCGTCNVINGPADPVCPGTVSVFTASITGLCDNPVYTWTVTGNVAGFTPGGAAVTVTAGSNCNLLYTVSVSIACDSCTTSPITCSDDVLVQDITAPSITCPVNTTVQCASQVPIPAPGSLTVTDNCGGATSVTHVGDAISGQTCANRYTLTRTYRATDACGNSATCTQTISVFDNTGPGLTCPLNVTVQCASQVPPPAPGSVTSTDNCGGSSTVTFVGDVMTNQTCANRFNVTRTYRATDACGNSATCTQVISVFDNTPPSITCPANLTVSCLNQVPGPNTSGVTSTDNCGGTSTITFVTDNISNIACANRFILTRTYRASDACGNSATCAQIITVFDNTLPSITCPANVTVSCASQVPIPNISSVTSSDNCAGAPSIIHVGDVTTNMICVNRFLVTRTYRATDSCGNSTACTQTITVFDNQPPSILCPANVTVQCASLVPTPNPALVTSTDNCGGTATVTHVGDAISNQTCTNRFNITRTYRAIDACGNSATCAQTITVFDNTAPSITCPANVTVQCANLVPAPATTSVTASDNCGGTATVTHLGDVTSGQTCANRFTVIRTYRAMDECGNSATCTQTITVFDNTAPALTCPSNVTVQCANLVPAPNPALVTSTDNCGGTSSVAHIGDAISGQTCTNRFILTRTYRAMDECGNSATCTQTITVLDNTAPALTCPPNVTVQCANLVPAPNPALVTSTDNCAGAATVTHVGDAISGQTCTNRFTLTRTYRATDECGNSETCTQTITVFDNTVPAIACPVNVTVQCANQVPAPNPLSVTSTDNCNGTATITHVSDVISNQACVNRFNVTRTYRSTDECGNSATCTQTITVFDNTVPSITCPANVTVQCANLVPAPNPGLITTSTDNCGGTTTITHVGDAMSNQTCANRFTVTRTYRATDECGNSATCTQTITVFDNTAPSITCPVNVTVQCANLVPAPNPGLITTSTDNCGGTTTVTHVGDAISNQTCANRFTVTRTYRATDECGNSASCTQTITVFDNTAPSITCPANVTVQCANLVPAPNPGLITTSTDNCGGTTTITHVGDAISNQTCANRFTVTRTYRATDECGNSASCTQTITVFDNTAPSITCPANVTVQCANLVPAPNPGLITTSTDNCGGTTTITHVGDVISNQTCANRFIVTRTYRAADECGNSATCTQTITIFDNTAPALTCPANVTVQCANLVPAPNPLNVTATDNCSGTATVTHVGDVISNQACINQFNVTRTYRATDECGNSATCTQTITVFDNTVPSLACPANVTVQCETEVPAPNPLSVTSTDNCSGTTTITHVGDVISNQTCVNRFNITRTYRATDECGNSATCTQTIAVYDNTAPSITCPADVTVSCASLVPAVNTGIITGSDNCGGAVIVGFLDDVTVNVTCTNRFKINRTYQASDLCGNTATCVQMITVFDDIPPSIACPANVTVSCASLVPAPDIASIASTDNCGGTMTITSGDVISNMTCSNRLTITRTYVATDNCLNSASCTQVITVSDDSTPSITCPADVTVTCAGMIPPPDVAGVTASDNCGGTATVTHDGDVVSNQICANRFTLTRTYRATDECGNSATCTQTISVNDIIPPGIMCPPNITLSNTESTLPDVTGTATSTDNCGSVPMVTNNDVTIGGQCIGDYVILRTWAATDECGNSSTCIQILIVDSPCNVDLALVKNLDAGQTPISGGDDVNFTITVSNEGMLAVGSITLIDYIPLGFSLNDPDWTAGTDGSTGQSATIILSIGNGALSPGGLMPGQMISVQITLQADQNIASGVYTNIAEITTVLDVNGNDVSANDIDSHPDTNDANDPEAEDDHDPVALCIQVDQVITGNSFVCTDDTVTYAVMNFNPMHMYIWSLPNGGGVIIQNNGSSIVIHWTAAPGGPYTVSLTDIAAPGCESTGTLSVSIQGGEPFACHTQVNISLDNECGTVVVSGMILTGDQASNNSLEVFLIDENGDTIPNATLTCEHIGLTLIASVRSQCSGQSCWGYITVEDKLPPIIDCVCPLNNEDSLCNVTCRQIQQMIAGDIPEELQPVVIDNCCGTTTLEIVNIDVQFDNCGGGFIRVTWQAIDASGNVSTCEQEFHIIPLTLETLTFPPDYEGVCGGSSDPSVTGWPQVDGIDLDQPAGVCNLYVTYNDLLIHLCGGGTKIIRTWTVRDWCTGEISVFSQAIFLADHQGPVLTCIDDFTIGTSVWYCYANVSVPRPNAIDACSRITTYHLSSPEGTVVNSGNTAVVNGLPIGTHTVTWTVTDECFNTSTCTIDITVVDNVPPVLSCQAHTIVGLTSERPNGVTLVPAEAFDDGSFDNCGPVSFRARRMDSCLDFDWTTGGACVDEIPGGFPPVNGFDYGTERGPCVPFACCDVGAGPIMVELEVSDTSGNVNYCMVEVEVQDKLSPSVECPPDITLSCEYLLLNITEGTFTDIGGNNDGTLDEDPLSAIFGNVYDAFRHDTSERKNVIILDPDNPQLHQPHNFGLEGWAKDNCEVNLDVTVRVIDDCSGASFPFQGPQGARKLIERIFRAHDGTNTGSCLQKIWIVDFDPFYITDTTCFNENLNDGVIWPCDVLLSSCPDNLNNTGEPIIFEDACSLVGINHKDARFDFVDSACYKVLREWQVIDWCQFNANTGYGLWSYVQTIRVMDAIVPEFLDCPQQPVELCLGDPGISLPANNQSYLGENDPNSSSCSVHVTMSQLIHEACSESIIYDVKIYPFNGSSFIQIKPSTQVSLDTNHNVEISFNTQESTILSIQQDGLPYNSPLCGDYHRVLWSVEDGCGNQSACDYLFRLEDCKDPTPVCIDGLSSVLLGPDGEVTIWASDFNASSFDDCTPGDELLFSFSGTTYEPSHTYTCDNVPEFDVELPVEIWAADGGSDQNCNGLVEWSERNKDFCITTIVISDNEGVCEQQQNALSGEILTDHNDAVEKVIVNLSSPGQQFPSFTTSGDGKFIFNDLPLGADYTITPERNDDYKNGVSTLDLVKIQKHLLGNELFTSPYQYIAADANNTRTVSALDILDLRKLILGLYTALPYNDSWRFIDKKYIMPDPANPWLFDEDLFISHWTGENTDHGFIAVKIGDVNNTVKANAQQILSRNERSEMSVKADVKEEARQDEIVEMKLTFPEIVSGFQWTMETDGLEFIGVYSGDIQITDNNVGLLEKDITTISWNGDVLSNGKIKPDISFTLRWKVIVPGKIHNRIRCTSLVTPAECYTANGEIHQVKFAYTNAVDSKEFALYQNKPNPWNGQTTIGFDLPADAHGRLTLFDATGKTVIIVEGDYRAGYNSITLTSKDLPFSGVLYYRLESGEYAANKKMVLIR